MKGKKFGVISLSVALTLSSFAPVLAAEPGTVTEQAVSEVGSSTSEAGSSSKESSSEDMVDLKASVLKKINQMFPGKFDFITEKDLEVHNESLYGFNGDDGVERYHVSFHKQIDGKDVYGSLEFAGEKLDLVSFHYDPSNPEGAFYPPKVNQEEALKVAEEFLNNVSDQAHYQYKENSFDYYKASNRTLTEPVRYAFEFERLQNDVPVRGLGISISVLGNGEVVSYYSGNYGSQTPQFEEKKHVLEKADALEKVKENLELDLYYITEYDHVQKEPEIHLAFLPNVSYSGVHATSGKWYLDGRFVDDLPKRKEIKMLSPKKASNPKPITSKQAKEISEAILKEYNPNENATLRIHSVNERTNHNGQKVFSVDYMFETPHSSYGSSLELDAQTGDILSFHSDLSYGYEGSMMKEEQDQKQKQDSLSYEEALNKAVEYVEKYAPNSIDEYAYPLHAIEMEAPFVGYYFSFPRVANGIPFMGDSINVQVSSNTGTLSSIDVNKTNIKYLPSVEKAVDQETAKKNFLENLKLDLNYVNHYASTEKNHFYLTYQIEFGAGPSYYDAIKGEWANYSYAPMPIEDQEDSGHVKHPWAEKELNLMIEKGIIKVKDLETFNPNAAITKGEALEVVMRSLTHFWEGYHPYDQAPNHTFENIKPDHPLYEVVERAVQMGMLDRSQKTFNIDEKITRQELAVWYVRALRLQEAAKHSEIYIVEFKDADQIDASYKGYVALASAFGILTGANGKFNPNQEVTLAQLSIATIRVADTINILNLQDQNQNYLFY